MQLMKEGKRGIWFPVANGWLLTRMNIHISSGSKWELYIPSELAYGDNGAGAMIPGGAALTFTIELLKVKGDYVKDQ